MLSKKVLIVLVEGISDQTALEGVVAQFISQNGLVRFKVNDGDILTRYQIINNSVGTAVLKCMKKYSYNKKDIFKVVHLIDIDGCYVSNDKIVYDCSITEGCLYSENEIRTNNVEYKIKKNENKRKSISALISKKFVLKDVPYEIYYFSCNLDHCLYNEVNLLGSKKTEMASEFNAQYENDLQGFISFIKEQCPEKSEQDSWKVLTEEINSLKRGSNFYLFFTKSNESLSKI